VCVNFFFLRSFIFLFKCLLSSYLITISLALFFENAARFLFQLLKYLSIVFLSLSLLLNFKLIFRLFSSSFLFFLFSRWKYIHIFVLISFFLCSFSSQYRSICSVDSCHCGLFSFHNLLKIYRGVKAKIKDSCLFNVTNNRKTINRLKSR